MQDQTPASVAAALRKAFRVRLLRSLLMLCGLSLGAWLLFDLAQTVVAVGERDHRHVDSWKLFTLVMTLGWVVSAVLEYRSFLESKRALRRRALR